MALSIVHFRRVPWAWHCDVVSVAQECIARGIKMSDYGTFYALDAK